MGITQLFTTFPALENDMMFTKMIDHSDDDQFIEMMTNPNCFKYTKGFPKDTPEAAIQLLDRFHMNYRNHQEAYIGLYLKSNKKLIGTVKVFNINPKENSAEISYRLHENYWHRGYAEMACRMVIRYLLHTIHVKTIYATAMKENKVNNHILNRCGFVLIKTLENSNMWPSKGIVDLNVYKLK